jgi:hypothetical protein
MRLWTLHPKFLDSKGLVAVWREALLAQAVVMGRTEGYRRHPQLARFRESRSPVGSIGCYLTGLHDEATRRGYRFDGRKIAQPGRRTHLGATAGQVAYEWRHLKAKLARRDPPRLAGLRRVGAPEAHPMFRVTPGPVETWEVRHRRWSQPGTVGTKRKVSNGIKQG